MPLRPAVAILLALLLAPPAPAAAASPLADHPSPYLALHAGDPVEWRLWGPEALAEARREGRLLFVSSGYFACHWCHVMRRESFSDPAIAALLNEHFVPVKVDRELLPALDARLIDFTERTRGQAGWPLGVFITPAGHPLLGFTYLPPERFRALLEAMAGRWESGPEALSALAARVVETLEPQAGAAAEPLDPAQAPALAAAFRDQALGIADQLAGGFGHENKFPMAPQLAALLQLQGRRPDPGLGSFLALTLEQMATQGLYDLLGGGFFRYTVDPAWHLPHFEKMLYDNAQLATLYLEAGRSLGRPELTAVGRETLAFMLRELAAPDGGFIASLSAVDDQDVEGGYYLWREETLTGLLDPEERAAVRVAWGLDGIPELEAGQLPRRVAGLEATAAELGRPAGTVAAELERAAAKLRKARGLRGLPRDGKVVAAWNGLALEALAAGTRLPDGAAFRAAGGRLYAYLAGVLWDGGRLARAGRGRQAVGEGTLEDYALVARGLLAWAEATGDAGARTFAARLASVAWERFHGPAGWRLGSDSLLAYGGTEPALMDSVLPSPGAVLAGVTLALARTGELPDSLARQAAAALAAGGGVARDGPFWYASYVRLLSAPVGGEG